MGPNPSVEARPNSRSRYNSAAVLFLPHVLGVLRLAEEAVVAEKLLERFKARMEA